MLAPVLEQPLELPKLSHAKRHTARPVTLWLLAVTLACAGRLAFLIHHYGVNLFFCDQWEFNDAILFEKHSLWQIFTFQHGWHRQGLGSLIDLWIAPRLGWDSKRESYVLLVLLCCAVPLALALKKKLAGSLTAWDAVIPVILLSPLQYESLIVVPNLAQGALPILLLMAFAYCSQLANARLRLALVLVINFVAVFTGLTLFLGFLTPLWIAFDYLATPREQRSSLKLLAGAYACSLATIVAFFVGYKFNPDIECFNPHLAPLVEYVQFLFVMFANYFGIRDTDWTAMVVGSVTLLPILAVFSAAIYKAFTCGTRARDAKARAWCVPILLMAFSLLLCVNTAYARICGGLSLALAPRYALYIEPAALGTYLAFTMFDLPVRWKILPAVALLFAGVCLRQSNADMRYYQQGKLRWMQCYAANKDVNACNAETHFQIYTHAPERTQLSHKLQLIQRLHINFYKPQF